jgi:hypothetical protein
MRLARMCKCHRAEHDQESRSARVFPQSYRFESSPNESISNVVERSGNRNQFRFEICIRSLHHIDNSRQIAFLHRLGEGPSATLWLGGIRLTNCALRVDAGPRINGLSTDGAAHSGRAGIGWRVIGPWGHRGRLLSENTRSTSWRRRPDEQQTPTGSVSSPGQREKAPESEPREGSRPAKTAAITPAGANFEALPSAWKR